MAPIDFDGDGPAIRYRNRNGKWVSDASRAKRREPKGNQREIKKTMRRRNIGVIDFETDRFDNVTQAAVFPFLCVIYSDQFTPIIIWNDDWQALIDEVVAALNAIDEPFIFYAHNGGRFDYMFLMHRLSGNVKFKGRALMSAKIGKHEIRDSLHIIPESLKNANRKDEIDYRLMDREVRNRHRPIIIDYCLSDCAYTFETVRAFVDRFGLPMTIGQASMTELKKHYSFERLSEKIDRYFRDRVFFGGRTECIAKPGRYVGAYKLFDVNSMYPSVMAYVKHPIGAEFLVSDRITSKTAFVKVKCRNNNALMIRQPDGRLTTRQEIGEFWTTIHEYHTATELGLISHVTILETVDFILWSTFERFVLPLYSKRDELKALLEREPNREDRKQIEQEIKFLKYLLNNAYGKFAQNPRHFKDHYFTAPGEHPPLEWLYHNIKQQADFEYPEIEDENERMEMVKRLRSLPSEETENYHLWSIPSGDWRFNNVATAASITGAARAKLLRAKHYAVDPLYCDTDSLICRDLLDHEINPSKLGSWKLEATISEVLLGGRKLYAYRGSKGEVVRAKGLQGVTWADMETIISGRAVRKVNFAPTITRSQGQAYVAREMRMTA